MRPTKCQNSHQVASWPFIICWWALLCLTFTTTTVFTAKTPASIGTEIEKDANGLKELLIKDAYEGLTDGTPKENLEKAINDETPKITTVATKIKEELHKVKKGEEKAKMKKAQEELKPVVEKAYEAIKTVAEESPETEGAVEKIKEILITGFLVKHETELTGDIDVPSDSKEDVVSPDPLKEIREVRKNAKQQFLDIKDKGIKKMAGEMTDAKRAEMAEEIKTELKKADTDATGKIEKLKVGLPKDDYDAAMAEVDLLKAMADAIKEIEKANTGTKRAEGEITKKRDEDENSDEENPDGEGVIHMATVEELADYQRPTPIARNAKCSDKEETSKCRGKINLCKNKGYFTLMRQKCRKTCAHCLPMDFECKDRYEQDCETWGRDFCSSPYYSKGMILMQCAKFCKLCT